MTARAARGRRRLRALRRFLLRALAAAGALFVGCLGLAAVTLAAFRWFDPPTTGVQIQRRVEAWLDRRPYAKSYRPRPLGRIDDDLEHAVVAAEDTRFFEHGGVDWRAIRDAVDDNFERGRTWRGGSTITQQLVKNLFQTTHRSWLRKAFEVPLAYEAEWILPKRRILELYLNVIEWGPGVYGAEAAAIHHFGHAADRLTREEAAALAATLPDPRRRRPDRVDVYRDLILRRMDSMGW